jgi:hypothetical protein
MRDPAKPYPTEAWHGFSLRVPDDFPNAPLRCVIAQVKMPYDDRGNGSPAFALRIDEGQWVATVEHLYEPQDEQDHRFLSAAVNGACGIPAAAAYDHHDFSDDANLRDWQVRAVLATDAAGLSPYLKRYEFSDCTTGVRLVTCGRLPPADGRWSDFLLHVAPSGEKNVDGLVELYCEGALIAQAWGELGYAPAPGLTQYFKVGPYRNNDPRWGDTVAAVEVRNIRRGRTKASVEAPPAGAAGGGSSGESPAPAGTRISPSPARLTRRRDRI